MTDSTNDYFLPEAPQEDAPATPQRDFEDLTLAELLREFVRAPRQTWRSLSIVTAPMKRERIAAPRLTVAGVQERRRQRDQVTDRTRPLVRLMGYLLAILLAAWANYSVVATPQGVRHGLPFDVDAGTGLPFWVAAFLLVLAAETYANLPQLRAWFANRRQGNTAESVYQPQAEMVAARLPLLALSVILSFGAYFFNGNNRFTLIGILVWIASMAITVIALAPRSWNLIESIRERFERVTRFPREEPTTFLSLLLIMAIASFIRLQNIDVMIPEMTSDHMEKLLDAQTISNGELRVFMEENGGRESAHFYMLALIDKIPGIDLNFMTLKILAALEGIFTIPVLWWMGREIIGKRDRRLGNIVGLSLALVAALGYWHIQLARIALRIVLTPLIGALLFIYLTRGVRYNHRADFIKAGLVLGFGLYTYQAVRMMPLMVVGMVGFGILFYARSWRLSRAYLFNLTALVIVAFVVFVPLLRYSVQYPESFWSRTSGRLLGEDFVTTTNELGQTITRQASIGDRTVALRQNVEILGQNLVNALLMFNYRGDVIFLHNAPKYPHLDPILGAFLIVGSAGWLVWMVKRREAVDWFIPLAILIMLLPSALAIAAPNENPSTTRASGALPLVFFLVSFGVAAVYTAASDLIPRDMRRLFATVGAGVLIGAVYPYSSWVLFEPYRIIYFQSWHPISQAGDIMRGFAESGGSYGNTWILSFRYWWDFRAIAIEAGLRPNTWVNGDVALEALPGRMQEAQGGVTRYPLDVNKDLLFFYHKEDAAAEATFKAWFPQGYSTLYEVYLPDIDQETAFGEGIRFEDKDFKTYRVPALGEQGFNDFLAQAGAQ